MTQNWRTYDLMRRKEDARVASCKVVNESVKRTGRKKWSNLWQVNIKLTHARCKSRTQNEPVVDFNTARCKCELGKRRTQLKLVVFRIIHFLPHCVHRVTWRHLTELLNSLQRVPPQSRVFVHLVFGYVDLKKKDCIYLMHLSKSCLDGLLHLF